MPLLLKRSMPITQGSPSTGGNAFKNAAAMNLQLIKR